MEFELWLTKLQPRLRGLVIARLDMISIGHLGQWKKINKLTELKWKNGLRVYLYRKPDIVFALLGGDKNGQKKDIQRAQKICQKVIDGTYSF